MKVRPFVLRSLCLLAFSLACFSFQINDRSESFRFPWKAAGLTEREAAAHLLSRFTFGTRPGDVDRVVKMGLEKWFKQQLEASQSDDEVNRRLQEYDALNLTNEQVVKMYPRPPQILKMAEEDGSISKDTLDKNNKEVYKEVLKNYMEKRGFKPLKELDRQFINQKFIRAAYSNNQLAEVLTDFWFNHFNVSQTKNDCAQFIPAYERDAIRKNVLGSFESLLSATAKSPAMLFYLDNFNSSGANTSFDKASNELFRQKMIERLGENDTTIKKTLRQINNRKNLGLNENYAREVMELHTLGVDGGYTQKDVTEAARVLTGWTIYPFVDYGPGKQIRKIIEAVGEEALAEKGFVHEGDFLFAANRHDNGEKMVLGKKFNNANGYQEGVELLNMLAHHPSTAKFISRKLAVRFVSDNPPASLVDRMAATFLSSNGSIKAVLTTMVASPEFWSRENTIRQKTKSPFELVISTVRVLNADIQKPFGLYKITEKLGQKLYNYQAPTGFPDKGQYWINTGALLARMNFGLTAAAAQKSSGVSINLLALNNGHEPESAEAALATYSKLLLPERNIDETVRRLTPLLNDPNLESKVATAAEKAAPPTMNMMDVSNTMSAEDEPGKGNKKPAPSTASGDKAMSKNMLAQVVGIIIGSPEFQRR